MILLAALLAAADPPQETNPNASASGSAYRSAAAMRPGRDAPGLARRV